MFHPPTRLFAVLPAITEMYLTEFLGVRFPSGYGLSYFNKAHNQLEGSLLHGDEIDIWDDIYDYISPIPDKGLFYILPETGAADVRALKRVIKICNNEGVSSSICGQAPSDYDDLVQELVKTGITSISVNPDAINRVRGVIVEAEKEFVKGK